MIRVGQIKIPIDLNKGYFGNEESVQLPLLKKKAAKLLRMDVSLIDEIEIVKHSIDARKKPELFDVYTVDLSLKKGKEDQIAAKCRDKNVSVVQRLEYDFLKKTGLSSFGDSSAFKDKKIIIIGAGPAGLFCGYELARAGLKPCILERGADVDERLNIVERFWESGKLDPGTNVQFGEGGAGTFSDGKLNTMVKDKEGRGKEALNIFVKSGAPKRISYESKPHIGTDILRDVVKNIRRTIIECGGEVHFNCKVSDIVLDDENRVKAVVSEGETYPCDAVILAIGHSARDTFSMLYEKKADMQPKPFAVGFRVEHPQWLIDNSQYGVSDRKDLPAAPYKLTTTTKSGRGVYSFCMCPGGYVVNASSEEGMLAVNGMSYSLRDADNANSAIIITVDPKDFGSDHVLSGVEFQRRLEKKAYDLAGGKIPVERYVDFKRAVIGEALESTEDNSDKSFDALGDIELSPCMKGAYEFANVHEILPSDLNEAFVEGMENFGRTIKGYNNDNALVSGVESRTSSPVRIVRGDDGESLNIRGLYPCGEGAGYAGGIMSAAMDGIRTAELVVKKMVGSYGER